MRKRWLVFLACLLCLAGAWFFWPREIGRAVLPHRLAAPPRGPTVATASNHLATASANAVAPAKTNEFPWRLSNTAKSLDQLVTDRHAILLENALIDSSRPLALSIPKNLQSQGDPGAYIVQARGPIDNAFRAMLARAGAEIVSYIPNNAYLVHAPAGVANGLIGNQLTLSVTPYEPYYKISSSMPVTAGQKAHSSVSVETNRTAGLSLLELAVKQLPLPAGTYLTLGLFSDNAAATVAQVEKLGGRIVGRDRSPFGPVLRVQPPRDWVALAALPGVQIVEPLRQRMHANDLSRVTVGVAADTQTTTNYLGLSGLNVLVQVNDSGIDETHPDLVGRVSGFPLTDTDGHGTHVAGIIAGDGTESQTVTNASGSIMPATNNQFRGMAPLANLLAMNWYDSDQYLQEAAAQTNVLISNNSWNYGGDNAYDLAAASYDAAVRDALPGVTGSQPVLFVFSAGNDGGGNDGGAGGNSDSILSPATAKNVITVGAVEQLRNITNSVTNYYGNPNPQALWQPQSDTSSQIAGYSSRGNVGIGTEGTYGRFKPDVVAPGSFVVSTRSEQWDQYAYYNPTNTSFNQINSEFLNTNAINYYQISIPENAVSFAMQIVPNSLSSFPFPANLQIFLSLNNFPVPGDPASYDIASVGDSLSIPPASGGNISGIQDLQGTDIEYAVWNTNSFSVYYSIYAIVQTTNPVGNEFEVKSNLNQSIGTFNPASNPTGSGQGPYYRYETGTSMAAADVSGVLALMQDYFINNTSQLPTNPSPALLKAMLINGARATGNNKFAVTNSINFQGWGLINLPNTLPPGITNQISSACANFFLDQSPTNALATGDSYTYLMTIANTNAQVLPLRVTLAWTDPPGNPAAAIKLVNSLSLVVSNTTTHAVYFGNNFASAGNPPFSIAWNTNSVPNLDSVNNIENVFLPPLLGASYTITVVGQSVNVNAVTAQTNNAPGNYAPNVVQDFALVISCGEGEVTNAFAITDTGSGLGFVSNPTGYQDITYVVTTNAPLLNQFVGASSPLLGTNQIQLTTNEESELNNIQLDPTNLLFVTNIITLGMTNQWHFYVVTNTGASDYTNAAFITFIPNTLSVPRMGVFANNVTNATRPEADIDLYVSRNPALMNLDPVVISNADKSVGRGGTEYVYYTDSAPGDVYYVGVYSEDQEASEYGFIPIFTDIPFSQPGPNGSQIVNGLTVPVNVPDGSTAHPGIGYVFALAIDPMQVKRVVVTDSFTHQNFGDLVGALTHGGQNGLSKAAVLNNRDPLGNLSVPYTIVYDDSGFGDTVGSQLSDGPGSLNNFIGQQADGPWMLAEADESLKAIGSVTGFSLMIEPHQDLTKGVYTTLGPLGWYYEYVDVPSGVTGMMISATNITQPPSQVGTEGLFVKYGVIPTLTNFDSMTLLTNVSVFGTGGSISNGLPLPPGRYWIGLYNYSVLTQSNYLIVNFIQGKVPGESIFTSAGPVPILDDAVTTDTIDVPANESISSMEVGLRVDHPRVSDLVFHLISPSGTRVLLVENRGGTTTNGMGGTISVTNIVPVSSSGGPAESTSVINLAMDSGTLAIYYNFYSIPDEMVVYDQTGATIFDSGQISGSGVFNISYTNTTYLTITMNPTINEGAGDLWDYTVNALQAKLAYLVLTEDTNKTTTPMKFAPPPFVPFVPVLATNAPEWHGSFEGSTAYNTYSAGQYFPDGWLVDFGTVDVGYNGLWATGQIADEGNWSMDLNGSDAGGISTNVPTVAGQNYTLSFAYARNPDSIVLTMGHPPFIPQANVLINGNTIATVVANEINSWASLNWQATSVVFTASSSLTHLAFASTDPSGNISGVLLDCVDLTPANLNDGFQYTYAGDYAAGVNPAFGGWAVLTNQVTVISNASLAYGGSTNLLALADGTISRSLPTIPGTTYTLSYAYRGPGAVSLWRGETNTVAFDSISGNNGIPTAISYTNGVVGQAFVFNGSTSQIDVPANASLDVGTGANGFTIDAWIYTLNYSFQELFEWNNVNNNGTGSFGGGDIGAHLELNDNDANGDVYGNIIDTLANPHELVTRAGVVPPNTWKHLAMTYDQNTGWTVIYSNGVAAAAANLGIFIPQTSSDFFLGNRPAGPFSPLYFNGLMDEPTLYNRPLSASEIKAIYNQGANGLAKYNTNAPAGIAQGLAEAQLTLNGVPQPIFFANDTNWQTATISFVATSTNTPLQIAGLEPGVLLDNFVVTTIPTNNYDLYYLPEQSLDTVQGENAYGQWQLEIQDDRAGDIGTNLSWQLRFNFNYTPPTIPTLTSSQVIASNIVPPGGIAYYEVIVPTNADWATNILLNTDGTLNLLFDAYNPPTGTVPPDYLILTSPATVSNSVPLQANVAQPSFAMGGIYYLGVQNTNAFAVQYDITVNFHLVPPPLFLPQLPELLAITNTLFAVTNPAIGGLPPLTYSLSSSVYSGPAPAIPDPTTNVITWTPDGTQAPAVYTFTNVVNDSASPAQWATNIFHVLVVLTNGQPSFPGAEGAGGFAIGGRGGDVYHVVNLNDSGPGSLRNGIISTFGSRTIIFDVSGTINLYSPLQINNPYITIAGQTAPGAGITLQGLTFSAESAPGTVEHPRDEVLRFLRCRPGDIYAQYYQGDSFYFLGVTNSIADHLSASWSLDTVLSTTYSTNVTVQWSMIAQSLDHSAYSANNRSGFLEHGYGSLIRYGSGQISYLHNLYADNFNQNPESGDNIQLDFINNVVCNWGEASGTNEDDSAANPSGYANYLNYRGNYFIVGSNTTANPNIAFASGVPGAAYTQIYQSTNFIDTNAFDTVLDGTNTLWNMFTGQLMQLGSPILGMTNGVAIATNSPAFAYEQVLAFAGATVAGPTAAGSPAAGTSLLRDTVDTNIVNNVRNKSGQIVDFISSNSFAGVYLATNFGVTYSGYTNAAGYWVAQGFTNFVGVNPWPVLASAPQPLDSDGDGIPDYWDITLQAVTGDPINNPSMPHNNHSNPDGYTDLEHYLNWLASPHALTVSNTPVDVDLYAVVGRTGNLIFDVGNPTNGTVTLGADGHTATFMPTNNYFGFASFDFSVTNLATTNGFDVTVSVMVSITNIATTSLPVTNAVPETNTVPAGGFAYYLVIVPPNAQLATNILLFASSPVNLWFSRSGFPTGTNAGDYILQTNSMGDISLLGTATNFIPTNIIAGGTYYLGVQNLNVSTVNFALEVDFYPPPPIPPLPPVPVPGGGIVYVPITVPTNADFATNILLYATGPVNLWYTTNSPPSITNATDVRLLPDAAYPGGTNGFVVLGAGTTPPLMPGSTYWLGVQNTNSFGIIVGLEVDFHLQLPPVPAGGIVYYPITVPTNADFATNILVYATGPLNLWYMTNTNTPPSVTNASDVLLLPDGAYPGGTNGYYLLGAGTTPPLLPGSTYYLGVQNTNSFAVTYDLEVDFHLVPQTVVTGAITGLTITATNIGGTNGFLLQWQGPTNFQYEIQWTTNLLPLIVWNTVLNPVINVSVTVTNGHFSWFDDGSLTGGLGDMKFYRVLGSLDLGTITGSGPVTNTVLAGATSQAVVAVPPNATSASNFLISATGPLNVWFNQTSPPAGNTGAGDVLMLSASTAGTFVLTVPPLVPGANYYLGFQNPGASNVTFVFQVAFGFTPASPLSNFSIISTNGGILLQWNGLTNYQYQVQWTTNLLPPVAWNTISNIVLTSTTGIFTFFDDGSLTGGFGPVKFYRLIAWPFMTPIPQTLSISSVTFTNMAGTNDLMLRWSAPTNYQYGIKWTTNLALPFSNWLLVTNPPPALAGGVYSFIDNGITGPPADAKFFRLYEY